MTRSHSWDAAYYSLSSTEISANGRFCARCAIKQFRNSLRDGRGICRRHCQMLCSVGKSTPEGYQLCRLLPLTVIYNPEMANTFSQRFSLTAILSLRVSLGTQHSGRLDCSVEQSDECEKEPGHISQPKTLPRLMDSSTLARCWISDCVNLHPSCRSESSSTLRYFLCKIRRLLLNGLCTTLVTGPASQDRITKLALTSYNTTLQVVPSFSLPFLEHRHGLGIQSTSRHSRPETGQPRKEQYPRESCTSAETV